MQTYSSQTHRPLTPYELALRRSGIRLPCVLTPIRTEEGRKAPKWAETFALKYLAPRPDGVCNTITSVQKDNLILTYKPTL